MQHSLPPSNSGRTDFGTVVLHWIFAGVLLASFVSGLLLAAEDAPRSWSFVFDGMIPRGAWWPHAVAGLVLAGATAAYVVYMQHAKLWRRISLDRARIVGLRQSGRPRWSAVNVGVHWVFFLLFAGQLATGALLYLGYGGRLVGLHATGAWLIAAYPLVHVLTHWIYGGRAQVLRIVKPARLPPSGAPQPLLEALAERLDGSEKTAEGDADDVLSLPAPSGTEARSRHATRLHAHPLTVALAAGATVSGLVYFADQGTRDVLVAEEIAPARAPKVDGDLADPAWRQAAGVVVRTNQGANFDGGATRVEIRAVHDGTSIYFAFVWDDPTRSLKHLPLIKKADGWHLMRERFNLGDENTYFEDGFAVLFARRSEPPGGGPIHLRDASAAGETTVSSGRGTAEGIVADIWHWHASRGGLMGYIDDGYLGPANVALGDPGKSVWANNFKAEPGEYRRPLQPLRLPKDLALTSAVMGHVESDANSSEPEGARWWMTVDESVPYSGALDAKVPAGTVIPGVIIAAEHIGDRAHVRCAAHWAAGRWTLEVSRKLNTGSTHDIPLSSGVYMWVAAFDHSQMRHTRHLRPVRLEIR